MSKKKIVNPINLNNLSTTFILNDTKVIRSHAYLLSFGKPTKRTFGVLRYGTDARGFRICAKKRK